MENHAPLPSLVVWSPVLFVAGWCAISFLLSAIGGWRRLAARFPARNEPSGELLFMRSGSVGMASYRGCLIINRNVAGFRLSVLFPFRLGHPPLFIPWSEVHRASRRRVLWSDTVSFEVGTPPITSLELPGAVFAGRDLGV